MIRRVALFVVIGLSAQRSIAATPPHILPPKESVGGISQSEYVVRWWQWANRSRRGVRPYQDPTGALCGLHQSGEVWFLAGTDGTDDVVRRCGMPVGKYLFLPVITMISTNTLDAPASCAQLVARAAENNDHLSEAEVQIDGVPVRNIARHRQRTPACFDAYPHAPYLERKGDQPKDYFPAASDGYWLMIKPLKPGLHHISVRARYNNKGSELGDLEQVFEYQLEIGGDTKKDQDRELRRNSDIVVLLSPREARIASAL